MPAKAKLDRSVYLRTGIPESLMAPLQLHLFSQMEGRIPKGAYQEFLSERIREFFEWRRIDLGVYGFPAGYFVSGPREMIEELERRLRK